MERPPSQLENVKPTGLRPPSRLPAMSNSTNRTLLETSQSDLNSRSAGANAMMPPPSTTINGNGSIKHRIPGLPEPPPKRKTLAERAGEPLNALRSHMPAPAPVSSKPLLSRSESTIAQTGSRPPSGNHVMNGCRNTSNASTSSSASTTSRTIRPPSRQQRQGGGARPPSVEMGEEEVEAGVTGKRKGTTPILSFSPLSGITVRKNRGQSGSSTGQSPVAAASAVVENGVSSRCVQQHSGQHQLRHTSSASSTTTEDGSNRNRSTSGSSDKGHHSPRHAPTTLHTSTTHVSASSQQEPVLPIPTRNISLCTSFAELTLTPKLHRKTSHQSGPKSSSSSHQKHRPSLSPVKELTSPSKIPKFSCAPLLRHTQSLAALATTPSPLKSKSSVNGLRTPVSSRRVGAVLAKGAGGDPGGDIPVFLTKEKLTSITAWDTKGRLEDMESLYAQLQNNFSAAADTKIALEENLNLWKMRVTELSLQNKEIGSANKYLTNDLERAKNDLHTTTNDFRQAKRDYERDSKDVERKHERDLEDAHARHEREVRELERGLDDIAKENKARLEEIERQKEKEKDDATAEMQTKLWEQEDEAKRVYEDEKRRLEKKIAELERECEGRAAESETEVQALRDSLVRLEGDLGIEKTTATTLRSQISITEARNASLEQEKAALTSKAEFLNSNQQEQELEFENMARQREEALSERDEIRIQLRKEEMARRKLQNEVLELKGNIRVFVRTKPMIAGDQREPAQVDYPDTDEVDGNKKMIIHGEGKESVTGEKRMEHFNYAFDRVFSTDTKNKEMFEVCRDLIQSVVDGYNVSILSYGQTGSGKTFGMTNDATAFNIENEKKLPEERAEPQTKEEDDGITLKSIAMFHQEMHRLRTKGWECTMEASYVEVYNEDINDLLGNPKDRNKVDPRLNASTRGTRPPAPDVKHDEKTGKTWVTNVTTHTLWPPPPGTEDTERAAMAEGEPSYTEKKGDALLAQARGTRKSASTLLNPDSSRSHSLFILTLKGSCEATGQSSEGVLNLVDLAGSERVKDSGAKEQTLKEAQAINKSLSSLGDVIAALGKKKDGKGHIPYKHSKLTELLQSSLGGTTGGKSSRTLLLLHLNPLAKNFQENRTSLEFGRKVNRTQIGPATATATGVKPTASANRK